MTIPECIARQYRQPRPDELSHDRLIRAGEFKAIREAGIDPTRVMFARWLIETGRMT